MAEIFNNLIDKFLAVSWRLLDLPLYALVLMTLLFLFLFFRFILPFRKMEKKPSQGLVLLSIVALTIPIALIVDYKNKLLKSQLETVNEKYLQALQSTVGHSQQFTLDPDLYIDSVKESRLAAHLSGFKMWQKPLNEAINLVTIRKENPKAAVFCAIIDLTHPGIQIMLTPEYTETKTFTSVFAQKYKCILAINGEAGNGMQQGSGYGEWVGNWVYKGKAITMLDTDQRPFLSFDQSNKARYSPSKDVVTEKPAEMYNAFWGRSDLLVDGKMVDYPLIRPYSRTIMAIDEAGERLFLMVVDGKRPDYSLGLTFPECAQLLLDIGAHDGMACDQGGSSCLYLDHLKGMVNRPADSDGQERVVYTHFGIKARM